MMRKITLILLLIFVNTSLLAISLEEAQKIARQNNKNFLATKANINQAKWNELNALTNFFPKFSLDETVLRLDDNTYNMANKTIYIPVLDAFGNSTGDQIPFSSGALSSGMYKTNYTTSLTIQQPIFNGGKIFLGYQISKLAKEQAILMSLSGKNNLDYSVAETYLNILKMNDVLEISEKSLASSQAQLKKVSQKFDLGMSKKSDKLQWQVKVENDKITLEEIKNSISVLKTVWKNLLSIKDDKLPLPEEIVLIQYNNEIDKYASLSDSEKDNKLLDILTKTKNFNPGLKNLKITEMIAKKGHQIAKGNFLPSFNLQYSRQFESDDKLDFDGETNWTIAAVASFPIFQSGANYTNLQKSKYELNKVKFQLDDAREKILMGAENSFYNLVTKSKKVVGNNLALKNAKENHKIVNNLYEQGMVTNSELLDAEIMLFAGEMNLAVAYYDYILAKYNLDKFMKK
ncbi:MAG: TolC family protein [Candidatus Cloacimonetes bacterium]|nr:TolC family protein [Candidatus Cloacimonadota bacterium]